jgi:hypothetical protein
MTVERHISFRENTVAKAEDVRLNYESTVNYHNTLVQMRFSVAALYMTAAAFLVTAHFADTKWSGYPILLPLLGLATTVAAWMLEIRTEALLANLVRNGKAAEANLRLPAGSGFFHLMSQPQPIGIRIPFFRIRLPNGSPILRYIFSHTFALELMYVSFLLFWTNAAWIAR